MMTIIFIFIIISILASVVVVAACVKSSRLTQWENLPETYDNVDSHNDESELSPSRLSQTV
ncbi:MAG: hypothetical protein AAF614_09430 [Chloroflexota bacterium]